jgi:hypothetical protein
MKNSKTFWYISRFVMLMLLYIIFFVAGSLAVDSLIPDLPSEPGMVSPEAGLLIMGALNAMLIIVLIESSRYRGWKLALGLAFAYYGAVTFIMQIETWYFLTAVTVSEELLPRLFIMGLPVPLFFIPLATLLLGKTKADHDLPTRLEPVKPLKEWVYKPVLIAASYVVLYWLAGYFIAWQNPELRAFYGSPGDALPFWQHTINTLRNEPGLLPFQALRGLLWALFALPVIYGSKWSRISTALLVGFFFSIPQNIGHILANPLMPLASIRFSHMIETAISTFIFGVIVGYLLYRQPVQLERDNVVG